MPSDDKHDEAKPDGATGLHHKKLPTDKEVDIAGETEHSIFSASSLLLSKIWVFKLLNDLKNLVASASYYMKRCTVDHSFYVKQFRDVTYLYMAVSTDDILVSFATYLHYEDFTAFLQQYYELSVQTGPVLNFIQMSELEMPLRD